MSSAKDPVDNLFIDIGPTLFDCQEILFDVSQVFKTLTDIFL
jgi:hypothetical protein